MSEKSDFYTIQQAAELLDMPTEKVHGLLRKGKLKARCDEETGRWLLDVRSVHGRLRILKSRAFEFDLLVLAIIVGLPLLAAGYTLVPLLF